MVRQQLHTLPAAPLDRVVQTSWRTIKPLVRISQLALMLRPIPEIRLFVKVKLLTSAPRLVVPVRSLSCGRRALRHLVTATLAAASRLLAAVALARSALAMRRLAMLTLTRLKQPVPAALPRSLQL